MIESQESIENLTREDLIALLHQAKNRHQALLNRLWLAEEEIARLRVEVDKIKRPGWWSIITGLKGNNGGKIVRRDGESK